ncbi:MAG: hypothetical protein V4857_28265 [Pseudomonadota bacterium]
MAALWSRLRQPSTLYIVVSLLVSFVGFARAFLFMKSLGLVELGVLVFVQAIAQGVVMLQFGLINGGYRIYATDAERDQVKINNLLFSFFGCLLGALVLLWAGVAASGIAFEVSDPMLLAGALLGIAMLASNWLTNTLLGSKLIAELNSINLLAVAIGVAVLPVAYFWGLWGALGATAAQPLVFVLLCLWRNKQLRPTRWAYDRALLGRVIGFGFIPFVAGIFVLLNYQIERWAIAGMLGAEALGRFYLVFLYASLFALVPGAVSSIFFPDAIRAFQSGRMDEFRRIIRKHLVMLLAYLVPVLLLTVFALPPLVALVFPIHRENVGFVFLFLPGLVALVLCDPLTQVLNSALRLQVILWTGLASIVMFGGLILGAHRLGMFSLGAMASIKSAVNIAVFLIFLAYLARHRRAILFARPGP